LNREKRNIWQRRIPVAGVYLAIGAISALHYGTAPHAHQLHDIYRRLYYLPIILAAFLGGLRGGLIAAVVVCAAYVPHAFGYISHDPASPIQKVLEMALYLAVGSITGLLVSRLQGTRDMLQRAMENLQGSLEQLRSTEAQLVQAAKLAAVGRLSAGLAHEIRNPLASIKGSAEILSDDFPEGHPKRKLLQVLIGESARLNQVLSRFLAFARPRPLEQREFRFGQEIEAVVALLPAQEEGRSIRFRLDPPAGDSTLLGDPEQLRQVWLNVLLNACQAAGDGGEVRVRWRSRGGMLRVEVRDSGAGFTPDALENAFTPFFTTKDQGSGLGLAISHKIIESHGGRIRAANAKEGGGLIEIELPQGSATAPRAGARGGRGATGAGNAGNTAARTDEAIARTKQP
jgi:signal transduction histidine kinase